MKLAFIHVPKTGGASLSKALDISLMDHQKASSFPDYCFKFAFVRDPYERFRSAFTFMRDWQKDPSYQMPFETFVTEWKVHERNAFFRPMVTWIDGPLNFLGRFENLEEDVARLFDAIGRPRVELPHIHKTAPEKWTDAMREKVATYYREDFERFGYGN